MFPESLIADRTRQIELSGIRRARPSCGSGWRRT